jgi:hypothetical protein
MMVQTMHDLFLTCTQNIIYVYITHNQSSAEPLVKRRKEPHTYLEGQCFAHAGKSPSTLVPCLIATAPPFDSNPLHPFPTPSVHITLYYNDNINNLGLHCPGTVFMLSEQSSSQNV